MQSQILSRSGPWPRQASFETEDEERQTFSDHVRLPISALTIKILLYR